MENGFDTLKLHHDTLSKTLKKTLNIIIIINLIFQYLKRCLVVQEKGRLVV